MTEISDEHKLFSDASDLAYSLRRAHLRRPLTLDMEELMAAPQSTFYFDSIEEAEAAIGNLHAQDEQRQEVDLLSAEVQRMRIAKFFSKYLPSAPQFQRDLVELTAAAQLEDERYEELEAFLEDLSKTGFDAAWKKHQKVKSGSLGRHVYMGILSALEVFVLLLMLNACSSAFENLVVGCLAFVYAAIGFAIHSIGRHQASAMLALGADLVRIRFLVRDRVINRALVNNQMDEAAKTIRRDDIDYRISMARTIVIQAIAVIAILRVVF